MIFPRSMVLWDRPRRGRAARPAPARSLACCVELLEERFLLAAQPAENVWYSLPVTTNPAYVDQSALVGMPAKDYADASDPNTLSGIQVTHGSAAAQPYGFFRAPISETTSVHSTLVTAQPLPEDAAVTLAGTLAPGDKSDIFEVPLSSFQSSDLLITFTWTDSKVTGLGDILILDRSAHVLLDQGLTSDPLAIDLRFSAVGAEPGAWVYVKILPASESAWSGRDAANYTLRAAPTLLIPSPLVAAAFGESTGSSNTLPVPPSNPSTPFDGSSSPSSSPATGPFPPSMPGVPQPPKVALPLPQAVSAPVGGIFATPQVSSATAGGVIAVVADPHVLDLAPMRSGPPLSTVGAARLITIHVGYSTTPIISSATSWGAEGGADELMADSAEEPEAAPGEEPSRLVLALPPAGIRVNEPTAWDPANPAPSDERAALPQLVDEPIAPEPPCTHITATVDPVPSGRSGVLFALLCGSASTLVGLSAPEISVLLRKVARGDLDDFASQTDRHEAANKEEETGQAAWANA